MKNKLKRLLSLVLVLVTAVSMLPVTPASAASGATNPSGITAAATTQEMPATAVLQNEHTEKYTWQSNFFYNNSAGRYYFYDYNFMGLSSDSGQVLAVCTNRGAATNEGVTYTKKSNTPMSFENPTDKYYPAIPFLDYYAEKFYGGQLTLHETYLFKVFSNSMVWAVNDGFITSTLLDEAKAYTYADFGSGHGNLPYINL